MRFPNVFRAGLQETEIHKVLIPKKEASHRVLYIIYSIEEASKSFLLMLVSGKLKSINASSSFAIPFLEMKVSV